MEYTQNYQLPLWDKEDAVLRTDFNENNEKIDAALGEKSRIAIGSYSLASAQLGQVCNISVGFRPKAVLISKCEAETTTSRIYMYSALLLDGYPIKVSDSEIIAQITEDGFAVQRHIYSGTDTAYYPRVAETTTYIYIAFA